MTWISIRPTDVLLFRDGKPFSAGEDHSASSIFPPTPLTLQGALRAKISMDLGVSFAQYKAGSNDAAKEAIDYIGPYGENLDTGRFTMRGPFLAHQHESGVMPLLPTPADLFAATNKKGQVVDYIIQSPKPISYASNLAGTTALLETRQDYENQPGAWLDAKQFTAYLVGDVPTTQPIRSSDLFSVEYRFGVSTDAETSYRVQGQLYNVGFIRMRSGVSLLVDVKDGKKGIPSKNLPIGNLTLGGEQGRAVTERVNLAADLPQSEGSVTGRFKIILLTPAYFSGGWQPTDGNWSDILPVDNSDFVTAALYKPKQIGGWNTAAGTARAMRAYASPGSVYYFDVGEREITLPAAFTQTPDDMQDAGKIGFGAYAVGTW